MHRRFTTALAASLSAILGCGTGLVPLERGAPLEVRLMPGEEVVLDGAGSFDPEGEELGYAWRQVSGPKVELREADTPWPRFVPSAPGRYEFELVVSAPPVGNKPPAVASSATERIPSEPARLVVNVLPPNRPPVITIDEELRAEPGQWAALDGGRVTDPDGDAVDFEWRQVSGGYVRMEPADGRARSVLVRAWSSGLYVFELVVRDTVGAESRARLRLIVAPNDRPPVAIARLAERAPASEREGRPERAMAPGYYAFRLAEWPHHAGGAGSPPVGAAVARTREVDGLVEVTLDATGSRDPDGDELEFRWTQTGGPHVRTLYTDPEKGLAVVSFDAPAEGFYRFRLVVSDGVLDSEPADVGVAVGGAAPSPKRPSGTKRAAQVGPQAPAFPAAAGLTANAGDDVFAEVGEEVVLSGSTGSARALSQTGAAESRILYDWRQVAGPRIRSFRIPSMAESARPHFTPAEPGRYVLALRVSAAGDRWSAPDAVTVTVLAANLLPYVILPPHVTARAGYRVTIAASYGDPDGDGVMVGWRVVSGERRELDLESDGPVAGLYAPERGAAVVEFIVRDSRGGETRSRVRVESRPGGRSPVACARAPAVARPGERVVLDGSESFDPEGEALEFGWKALGDVIVRLEGEDRPRAVFRPGAPGRYEFSLVVKAAGRASSPARVAVEVTEPAASDTGMLAVAQVRPRVGAGRPVVLHAPGARGKRVHWRQLEGPALPQLAERGELVQRAEDGTVNRLASLARRGSTTLSPPRGIRKGLLPTVDGRCVLRPGLAGRYAFRLETPEGRARSRVVRFVVSESNARPVVKLRVVGARAPGTVVLDGTGSFDPDGDPLRFRWVRLNWPALDGPAFEFAPPAAARSRVRLVNVPPGSYGVRLVATDGERVARSDVVRFIVEEDGEVTSHRQGRQGQQYW